MKREWTEEQKQNIIQKYTQEGWTYKQIGQLYGAKPDTISKYMREWGYHSKTNQTVNRTLIENFFETIDSSDKAYFLGLMLADGSVVLDKKRSPMIGLTLVEDDANVLNYFKQILKSGSSFYVDKRSNREKACLTLSFRSQKMADDLSKYGIVPNKTYITKKIIIPDKYRLDYLRGFIDGDGSVYIEKTGRFHINICGHTEEVLNQIVDLSYEFLGTERHDLTLYKGVYRYVWNTSDSKKLARLLYDNDKIAIARKREKARLVFEDK